MKKIEFEQLNNTRDLGGIVVQDGYTIVPDRLIRSGRDRSGQTDKKWQTRYRV